MLPSMLKRKVLKNKSKKKINIKKSKSLDESKKSLEDKSEDSDSGDSNLDPITVSKKVLKNKSKKKINVKESKSLDESKKSLEDKSEDNDSEDSDLDPIEHKKSLQNLKNVDPEFYAYLQQNDKKLLDFDLDDEEDGENLSSGDENESTHIPNEDLEVASDDSEYEADADGEINSGGAIKVTVDLLKSWTEEIQTDKSSTTIRKVVEAFHAALVSITDPDSSDPKYVVGGGKIFNEIIQLCIMYLPNAFKNFLKVSNESSFEAHRSKRFKKIRVPLKSYLMDLLKVLQNVTSTNIIETLLKHLHAMLPFTQSFLKLRKPLLNILLEHWSTGEETKRVIAFLCILKIAVTNKESILDILIKDMYMKYVKNSKFVSPTTLPGINFMKRSLTEICLLDSETSYSNAFLYIRQLSIHLRNAITLKKKENFEAVYNWQFINSLGLWSELISKSNNNSMLRKLLYPLVQLIIGTIKLIPTAQFYPLRFHCTQLLIHISKETGAFIPILPFLIEILNQYDFNKKHSNVSMKPIPLICILRISKSQLQENGFKDSIMDTIYELILESAAKDSHTVYFPDIYVPCIIQLKAFLKKCHVANYSRKIKQLLEKIEENRKFIEQERSKVTLDIKDMREIENWELNIKNTGTPLNKFYDSWIKIRTSQKIKLLTQNDEMADMNLPTIKRNKNNKRRKDSDEDSDLEIPVEEMEKRLKKQKKTKKVKSKAKNVEEENVEDPGDIVKDITSGDWD